MLKKPKPGGQMRSMLRGAASVRSLFASQAGQVLLLGDDNDVNGIWLVVLKGREWTRDGEQPMRSWVASRIMAGPPCSTTLRPGRARERGAAQKGAWAGSMMLRHCSF